MIQKAYTKPQTCEYQNTAQTIFLEDNYILTSIKLYTNTRFRKINYAKKR